MNFFLDHDVPTDVGRVLRLKSHTVELLEDVLPKRTDDLAAMRYAAGRGLIIITCNRGDFLRLAKAEPHRGLIILIRRRTRIAECAALLRFLGRAGEAGISGNVNFA